VITTGISSTRSEKASPPSLTGFITPSGSGCVLGGWEAVARGRDGKNCGREEERRYLIDLGENWKRGNWGGDAGEGGFICTDYLDLDDLDDKRAKTICAPCICWMAGDPLT
jgi:hypothetical protein